MIRRINLIGIPGSGKSTIAPKLFSELKVLGYSVELCRELEIKQKAYRGEKVDHWEAYHIHADQLLQEWKYLQHVNHVVTDAPLELAAFYADYYKSPLACELREITQKYEEKFPSLKIYINRDHTYQSHGRYQSEEQSDALIEPLSYFLDDYFGGCDVSMSSTWDIKKVAKAVSEILDK